MRQIAPWILPALLFGFFVLGAFVNASVVLGIGRKPDETHTPSMVPFVPGIAGAIALAIAPNEAVRPFFWVPLLLDLGSGGYLLLVAVLTVAQGLSSGKWLRQVPFLRYLVKPEPLPPREPFPRERAIIGCILGTAVGDAMGLACEGLSRGRQMRMFPELDGYTLLPSGKGMCSDDTEHTCMLAQSLIETAGYRDVDDMGRRFASNLGWRLRFWLLGLPAGIGLATLRAILKLWIGFPARYSGVFSAGNGPAMRVALIGVCYGDDGPRLRALVRAATRVTHTDPKAEEGALAVALAAHLAATVSGNLDPQQYRDRLAALTGTEAAELMKLVDDVISSVSAGESAADYAARIGCQDGVTGYIYHTVPVALHVWLRRHSDYRGALIETVRLGGDTDTVAAVVGALAGARVGKEGIPSEWLRDLWEWPRTKAWMEQLGVKLAERCNGHASGAAVPLNWLKLLLRNALFILLVLAHGFRRLLPPY
jgi:ADP-ribosylglycohydrolase